MPILMSITTLSDSPVTPNGLEVEEVKHSSLPSLGELDPGGGRAPVFELRITRSQGANGIGSLMQYLMGQQSNPLIITTDFYEAGKRTPYLSLVFGDAVLSGFILTSDSKPKEIIKFTFTKLIAPKKVTSAPSNPKHAMDSAQWRALLTRLA